MHTKFFGIALSLVALWLLTLPVAAQNTCEEAIDYGQQGRDFVNQENYDEAISALSCAIDATPDDSQLYFYRAGAYVFTHDYDLAIADYDTLLAQLTQTDPLYFNVLYTRGFTHGLADDHPSAIDDFSIIIEILNNTDPNNAEALVPVYQLRAVSYRILGQYDDALNDYTQAIALSGGTSTLYAARGFVHHDAGDDDAAANDWSRAQDIDESITEDYRASIPEQWADERYDDALRTINDAIILDRFNQDVIWENYALRAATYIELDEYQAALDDVDFVMSLINVEENGGDAGFTLVIQAEAYLGLGDYDRALARVNRYIEIDARDPEAYRVRGDIYYAMGDFDQARVNYESFELIRTGLVDEQTQQRLEELREEE